MEFQLVFLYELHYSKSMYTAWNQSSNEILYPLKKVHPRLCDLLNFVLHKIDWSLHNLLFLVVGT